MRRLAFALATAVLLSGGIARADTPTPTRTPYSAQDGWIDDFLASTSTPTGTATPTQPTPTITKTKTITPTPTAHGCGQVALTGFIFNADGSAAVGKRVTINVPRTENVNAGCVLHPSIITYVTEATGAIPSGAHVVAGSTVQITLENGSPVGVTVPQNITTIDIHDLLGN